MRMRPILMNSEMVRAILDGRKAQTRRPVKQTFDHDQHADAVFRDGAGFGWVGWWGPGPHNAEKTARLYPGKEGFLCPFGQSGDGLWVREAWRIDGVGRKVAIEFGGGDPSLFENLSFFADCEFDPGLKPGPWIPSIHMPRWASRITLEITDVRVERLQDISETDAIAEGLELPDNGTFRDYSVRPEDNEGYNYKRTAVESYQTLWDSAYGHKASQWSANPWVWVVGFRRGVYEQV